MEEMIGAVKAFHGDDSRKEYYSRDVSRKVLYFSTFNLFNTEAADWRDTLVCEEAPQPIDPQLLPPTCQYVFGS